MKNIFTTLIGLMFATSALAAANAQTVVLVDAETKDLAKAYVQESSCLRTYEIKTRRKGIIDRHTEVVAQVVTLRSKANPTRYYRIFSDARGDKGYGLLEVGVFSLPRCADYKQL